MVTSAKAQSETRKTIPVRKIFLYAFLQLSSGVSNTASPNPHQTTNFVQFHRIFKHLYDIWNIVLVSFFMWTTDSSYEKPWFYTCYGTTTIDAEIWHYKWTFGYMWKIYCRYVDLLSFVMEFSVYLIRVQTLHEKIHSLWSSNLTPRAQAEI